MESMPELENLRAKIEGEIEAHSAELARLTEALKAIEKVEGLLHQSGRQTMIPEVDPYRDLGPTELITTIVNGSARELSVAEIIDVARKGGREFTHEQYNGLHSTARRLSKKGVIQANKGSGRGVKYSQSQFTLPTPVSRGVSPANLPILGNKKPIEYAAEILRETGQPMKTRELFDEMRKRGCQVKDTDYLRTTMGRLTDKFSKDDQARWRIADVLV